MEGKLLLIWDDTDLGVGAYVFDADSEPAAWARASAGLYINSDDIEEGHPIERLSDAINDGRFVEVANDGRLIGPYAEVVICGAIA